MRSSDVFARFDSTLVSIAIPMAQGVRQVAVGTVAEG